MTTVRSAVRCAGVTLLAAGVFAPQLAFGNHFILPCDDECLPAQFVYIGNSSTDHVTVVDTITNAVVASVNVGQRTSSIAVAADGRRVYAANGHSVVAIDAATNTVAATINYQTDSGTGIGAGVAVNPAGTRIYVTDQRRRGVAVIDAATNTVIANVTTVFQAFGIAVNPDGTRVYVTSPYDDFVSVIDADNNAVVAHIPIDNPFIEPPRLAGDFAARPGGIVVDPSGTRVYVANSWLGDFEAGEDVHMTVLDAATNAIIENVPIGPRDSRWSNNIAMNGAGTRVYLSNGAVIDTASNEIVGTLSLPACCLAVNSNGTRIYAVIEAPPSLAVVDAETSAVLATVPLEGTPIAWGQFIGPPAENSKRVPTSGDRRAR